MIMKVLAIETSCDETALALLEATGGSRAPRMRVVKNLVSSQVAVHAPFGGVVPNLAKREHLKNLPVLFKKLLPRPERFRPDLIAVTVGPGLEPALWTGINFAETLATQHFPHAHLIGANHLEGHLYSFALAARRTSFAWPAIALIVSGGHTILIRMDSLSKWRMLGETRDDAVGEAFDKVARILDLPYPGGPEVERLAARGNPNAIPFPRPMLRDKSYDFSFSGLKTSVLYYTRDSASRRTAVSKADVAASFQAAATEVLIAKTVRAVREHGARAVFLSGGVAANRYLRTRLAAASRRCSASFFAPPFRYNTDNAAMIGVAGYLAYLRKKRFPLRANGTLSI